MVARVILGGPGRLHHFGHVEVPVSTILFVDDHHALRTVFAETLRSAGHVVLEAGTLADAEYLVERHSGPVDVLIVDVVLTTTNGRKVAERFQPMHPAMQVLFVSDRTPATLSTGGLLPKGAHFLHKPFAAEDVIAAVGRLLRGAKPSAPKPQAKSSRVRRTRPKTLRTGSYRGS